MAWSDVNQTNNSNSSGSEVKFVKFPVGVTKLRVLDEEPFSRWTHWIQAANGGKGMSVNCIGRGCPVCKVMSEDKKTGRNKRYNASKSHSLNVFVHDQKVNGVTTPVKEVQVMDKGNGIYGSLYALFEQMGDLRNYDVTVTRVGENLGEIKYTILPVFPPAPLSDEDLAKCTEKYDIIELNKPLTAEQIETLMAGGSLTVEEETQEETAPNVNFGSAV